MKIEISARTDVGMVREHNEDNYLISPDLGRADWFFQNGTQYQVSDHGSLLVVADGMGGASAGEIASKIAVDTTRDYFQGIGDLVPAKIPDAMKRIFKLANEAIAQHARQHPETDGMGTTMVIAWLKDEMVHVSWVGDSRGYLLRKGEGMIPLTKDHSLVQEWIDEGKLTEEQAFYHPQNSIVTQSLGDDSRKLDPGYTSFPLQEGDRLLLCSDGLNGMLFDNQIAYLLAEPQSALKDNVESLIRAALDAGGKDNVTLIITDIFEAKGAAMPISSTASAVNTAAKADSQRLRLLVVGLAILVIGGVIGAYSFFAGDEEGKGHTAGPDSALHSTPIDSPQTHTGGVDPETENLPTREENRDVFKEGRRPPTNESRNPESAPAPTGGNPSGDDQGNQNIPEGNEGSGLTPVDDGRIQEVRFNPEESAKLNNLLQREAEKQYKIVDYDITVHANIQGGNHFFNDRGVAKVPVKFVSSGTKPVTVYLVIVDPRIGMPGITESKEGRDLYIFHRRGNRFRNVLGVEIFSSVRYDDEKNRYKCTNRKSGETEYVYPVEVDRIQPINGGGLLLRL